MSPPFVWEIFDIKYDEDTFQLNATHNSSDPESGLRYNDFCLGYTRRDCNELHWTRLDFNPNMSYITQLTDGIPIWVKIKAVNRVDLRTKRVADAPIIVDKTPPIAGHVNDGPVYKTDLMYTKNCEQLCSNWHHFYDPESGIGYYMVSAGSEPEINVTDVANLTEYDRRTYEVCIELTADNYLEHGQTYYTTVWAFNAGIKIRNVSAISNGVTVDLTKPVPGSVIDGNNDDFTDIQFSASPAKVEVQWRNYTDPESTIYQYEVLVQSAHNGSTDFNIIRNWVPFNNDTAGVKWLNFHLHHNDYIILTLRTTNGALNSIVNDTDGFLVDLTPPKLIYIRDGTDDIQDAEFQSNITALSARFKFIDDESGIGQIKVQIFQQHHGIRAQILPVNESEWIDVPDDELDKMQFSVHGLPLKQGGFYSMKIGAVNNAGMMAAFETNGVLVDTTPPVIHWLRVGALAGVNEDKFDGYVWQADTSGIKAAWLAVDPQSGIKEYMVSIGSHKGGTDILGWKSVGTNKDAYIKGLSLTVTDEDTKLPVYFVTITSVNGAGLTSEPVVSTPIIVVTKINLVSIIEFGSFYSKYVSIVVDGTDSSYTVGNDINYQSDISTVSAQFSDFTSHLHGVMSYEWSIGSEPAGEDVLPFTSHGIVHKEERIVKGDGVTSSGFAHTTVQLQPDITYYSTVRGITNAGNVLESVSDGFTVDRSPPTMEMDRAWLSVGTHPYGSDVYEKREVNISSTLTSDLPLASVLPDLTGKPNIISIWAENEAGLIGHITSGGVIFDTTSPGPGFVKCPEYVGILVPINCKWTGFLDSESPIQRFIVTMGSEQGASDVYHMEVAGYLTEHSIQGVTKHLKHGKSYYVTVTAINMVDLETYGFSGPIAIDTTPPKYGRVIDLHTTYRLDVTDNEVTVNLNAKVCDEEEECDSLEATCSESLSTVSVTWQPFSDFESGIVRYQIAVGTTPGGGQIRSFFDIPIYAQYYTVTGLDLMGYKTVFVSVKGENGAGLASVATSNGLHLSYLSQGLRPVSHIGINDVLRNSIGDVYVLNFQESFDTYRASWDVSGDPCSIKKYEWQVQRLDGQIIQQWLDMRVRTSGMNDEVHMESGALYYSLLKVTNALNYTYIIRSNGVTIQQDPLIPGKVFDGDITGYDLNFMPSRTSVSANWDSFGLPPSAKVQFDVISGNPGIHVNKGILEEQNDNQQVTYFEVAVGTDRRFPKTRDNIVPYTNVYKNKSVTFYNLDLVPGSGLYYFTVKAYSASYSIATVTSNGFRVGFDGSITAGKIIMADFVNNSTQVGIQFEGFQSKLDILMYYVALSNHSDADGTDCQLYIEGGKASDQDRETLYNIFSITNVNKNTYYSFVNLELEHGESYFAWVIGVDESGECAMISHRFVVDLTPPIKGKLTTGSLYDMPVTYTVDNSTVQVLWEDYNDPESGIETFEVSLWNSSSCSDQNIQSLLHDWIELTNNYTGYSFVDLQLEEDTLYIVQFKVTNKAGLYTIEYSPPVLYDLSTPTPGKVVAGKDFLKEQVWFSSGQAVTGTLLHLPKPYGPGCPSRHISMINDGDWRRLEQIGFRDPSGTIWKLHHRKENIDTLIYDNAISVKLARHNNLNKMFTGAYVRPADIENGGVYDISIKAAGGDGLAVTGVMFWDGPEDKIATFTYEEDYDWVAHVCECCLMEPVPMVDLTTSTTTEQPVLNTTTQQYEIVNNPDGSIVDTPIDTSIPITQAACGEEAMIVTWCQSYNNTFKPMKAKMSLEFDPSENFHDYHIEIRPERDDAVDISWCLFVFVDGDELTMMCGIPYLSNKAKLVFHVWNRENTVPEHANMFNRYSTKAFFKNLIMPAPQGSLCRYGNPFRGGTNPVVKFEAGIGRERLSTDVSPFSEVLAPCLPCQGMCSNYMCNSACYINDTTDYTFTLQDVNLAPVKTFLNESGLQENITLAYFITVKAVLGSGLEAISSSSAFYLDDTPPVFDPNIMNSQIYIDVIQGEFTPVNYQASRDTIKAFWRCYDDESQVADTLWAIGSTVGGEELQEFQSVGRKMIAENKTFDGILQHNTTYYVSVRCINGGGALTQWNETKGVIVLLVPPEVDNLKNTLPGTKEFSNEVNPKDARESTDPRSIGITFTASEDKSVIKYDMCIGSSENKDDILPCQWIGLNESGSAMIKDGYLYINGYKTRPLSVMQIQNNSSNSSVDMSETFHMEPGRTLFMTMRVCNEAMLCSNKSIGSVSITNNKTKLKTSVHGESVRIDYDISTCRREKRDTPVLSVTTPDGLMPGQSIMLQPLDYDDLTTDYRADVAFNFQPYIVNPSETKDMVERILYKRIRSIIYSFSITPIGHLSMPGPLNITIERELDEDEDSIISLIHWNQVCSTRSVPEKTIQRKRRFAGGYYFSEETQFIVAVVDKNVYNSPPVLLSPDILVMDEDQGTIQYTLRASDEENDVIEYHIQPSFNVSDINGTMFLTKTGILLYTPCRDCTGVEQIPIILQEVQRDNSITAIHKLITLTFNAAQLNDPPVVFMTQYGQNILHDDPTEPVLVYLEQMNAFNGEKWSSEFSATFGAYDIEKQDLFITVSEPTHGRKLLSKERTSVPNLEICPPHKHLTTEPCGNFSHDLPHEKDRFSWIYANLTYKQNMSSSGNDFVKIHITDSLNATSTVLTVQFVLMESPCQQGVCTPKRNYPCRSVHRSVDFDKNYICTCTPGYTGKYCTDEIDECQSSPCVPPYVCNDVLNGYICHCPIYDPNCVLRAWVMILIMLAVLFIVCCVLFGLFVYRRRFDKNQEPLHGKNVDIESTLSDDDTVSRNFISSEDQQDFDTDSKISDHERFLRYLQARKDIPYADQKDDNEACQATMVTSKSSDDI
ncbi:unnamed protein product [Mytilus edulis]|uniref:EGF-like domain-containing protein n=1 Tax=Mytilus edulis TaxID=6550 RepID=A0A8S3PVH0_MYTED|nr:unnamed protein product [Mytilus edulis]